MLFNFIQKFPNDTGTIYQETIEGRLPVEPFNTFSNLIFLIMLIYFGKKIYKNPKQHPFFLFAIPIIFISWIGGTMYHGTRSHQIWLILDGLPILLVCLGGIIYFVGKIKKEWWQRILLFLGLLSISILPRFLPIPSTHRISFGYAITALTVIIPFAWYAYLTQWRNSKYIVLGFLIFAVAVTFRTLDNLVVKGELEPILPMGTHWLWHTFGGIAVFFLLYYIYLDKKEIYGG